MSQHSAFEENEKVAEELSSAQSGGKLSSAELRRIRDTAAAPIARAHAQYYIKKREKARLQRIGRAALGVFSSLYLAFTLCRVYWYHHPEKNPFPQTNFTIGGLFGVLYIAATVYVIIKILRR